MPSSIGSLHSSSSEDSDESPDEEIYGTFEEAQRRDPAQKPPSGSIMGVERPGVSQIAEVGSVYEVPRHAKRRIEERAVAASFREPASAFRAKLTPTKKTDAVRASMLQQKLAKKYGIAL
jgi:hypothetical protein